MTVHTDTEDTNNVLYRSGAPRFIWLGAPLFSFMGALSLSLLWQFPKRPGQHGPATDPGSLMFVGGMALFYWVVALLYALFALRYALVVTDEGIRWRILGKWKRARWNEVTDYYEKTSQQARTRCVVETSSGQIEFRRQHCNRYAELRELIVQRATSAKARRWAPKNARAADEWPQVFVVDFRRMRLGTILFAIFYIVAAGGFLTTETQRKESIIRLVTSYGDPG